MHLKMTSRQSENVENVNLSTARYFTFCPLKDTVTIVATVCKGWQMHTRNLLSMSPNFSRNVGLLIRVSRIYSLSRTVAVCLGLRMHNFLNRAILRSRLVTSMATIIKRVTVGIKIARSWARLFASLFEEAS